MHTHFDSARVCDFQMFFIWKIISLEHKKIERKHITQLQRGVDENVLGWDSDCEDEN